MNNWLVGLVTLVTLFALDARASNSNVTSAAAVQSLEDELSALSPQVRKVEADRAAACAYATAANLKVQYQVIGPPLFHNFLVNTGIRKRGLCYQWAEDLIASLDQLRLRSLELHWGVARANTMREHNCVVLTARGRPFAEGVVLDCWRNSGRLFHGAVAHDHYPWHEDVWDWRAHVFALTTLAKGS